MSRYILNLLLKLLALVIGLAIIYVYYSTAFIDAWLLVIFGFIIVTLIPNKSPKQFILDWSLFAMAMYLATVVRGLSDGVMPYLVVDQIIQLDRWLFAGNLPTVVLQQWLYQPGILHWFDWALMFAYISFFIFPFVVAYALWLRQRISFYRFVFAFFLLDIFALLFFLFLPVAPPWYAAYMGRFQMHNILLDILNSGNFQREGLTVFVRSLPTNDVAAMPSLHSAWPLLAALFAQHYFGRWARILFIIPAAIWLAVVYFGQHYVADVIMGIFLTILAYYLTMKILPPNVGQEADK